MYLFLEDPGHGWLKVSLEELHELGIANQISHYSYQDGRFAYLEEDCDAPRFLAAKEAAGQKVRRVDILHQFTNGDAACRSYQRYRGLA